jgi:hypothetical protein
MSYRNKTYVIFDGDNIHYYRLMQAWRKNENIDFNFYDVHETRSIYSDSEEESVKRGLRDRFSNSSQAITLVGEHTRYLFKYVRWEIEVAQSLGLPIMVANLDGKRMYYEETCPPLLRDANALFVSYDPKIIKLALDNFPDFYHKLEETTGTNFYYNESVYSNL